MFRARRGSTSKGGAEYELAGEEATATGSTSASDTRARSGSLPRSIGSSRSKSSSDVSTGPIALLRSILRSSPSLRAIPPLAYTLVAASLFLITFVSCLRYVKISGILRPAYHKLPEITEAQRQAASTRHATHDQCMAAYPRLYDEADRVVDYWIKRGGVSLQQVERAARKPQTARVMIKNGELYVKSFEPERHSRTRAALASINEAIITSTEPIPDVEFVIQTDDAGDASEDLPLMVLDRKAEQNFLWLMPDYAFYSWPEPKAGGWTEAVRKANEYESRQSWDDKVPQAFFRGPYLVPIRRKLHEISRSFSWAKVEEADWRNKNTIVTMDDHCGYKYLFHVEGFAYSGRLKYILQCKSVVIAHEMQYLQHYNHLIRGTMYDPEQNMVIIPGQEWKDLPRIMDTLIEDDGFAKDLAERQHKFWSHYLSKQSIDCYWRYLFRRWAEVQRFEPELKYETTPYVSFNLLNRVEWDAY